MNDRLISADNVTVAALLTLASFAAWLAVLAAPAGMSMSALSFMAAWTVMMTAMMLPSAAPLVLLYRRGTSTHSTLALIAGYLLVWALLGLPAHALETHFMHATSDPTPLVFAAAGLYQLTPLKLACLQRCRSPADFLMQRWNRSGLRLGIEHGLWCAGCCWALMLVLVLAGSMGLAWVVVIAAIVAVEKLTARGALWARMTGAAFLLAAIVMGVGRWPGS